MPTVLRVRSAVVIGALALLVALAMASPAFACACCVAPGTRGEGRNKLEAHHKEEIDRIVFSTSAWLHATEAFPDDVKGIAAPQTERYKAEWQRTGALWSLTLTAWDGRRGVLRFAMPKQLGGREVHIPPRLPLAEAEAFYDKRGSVTLYKEWVLTAPANGDGLFGAGLARGGEASLILHGEGNGCPGAEQFHAWTLVVKGPAARFTLYGRLVPLNAEVEKKSSPFTR